MHHETIEKACEVLVGAFGVPTSLITTTAIPQEIEARYRESKEMGAEDELPEDAVAELKEGAANAGKELEKWQAALAAYGDRVKQVTFDTGVSRETLT